MKKIFLLFFILLMAGCATIESRNPDPGKCEQYPDVCKVAPETLRKPYPDEFINEESYKKALDRYNKYGHWDTYENDYGNN